MKSFVNSKFFSFTICWIIRKSGILLLCTLCLGFAACATLNPSKDVELTWHEAYIRIPGFLPSEIPPNTKFPIVIYMHGSGGLSRAAYRDIDVALKAGVAVIALNSYARTRPRNPGEDLSYTCPQGECWRIFNQIFALRTAELTYALKKVRQVPWIDQGNVFVWGQSEGGYTVAAYSGAVFKGRIITGTGCHWGFKAKEPVIAVISRDDPYVRKSHGEFSLPSTCLKVSGNAKNLTYVELPGSLHNGAQSSIGERAVIEFLHRHISSSK